MEQDDDWKRLVETLDAWTSASEIAVGQIDVSLPHGGASRHVVVVMTPDQWNCMTGTMWGNFDDAFEDVKRTLLNLQPHEGFAVYSQYRLEPSTDPTLPDPPRRSPEPGGEWFASSFADRSEPHERR